MNSFFNTTGETNQRQLKMFNERALAQEVRVLKFFRRYPCMGFTSAEVYNSLYKRTAVPETSVRRAISRLRDRGQLYNKGKRRIGNHGSACLIWYANE